MTPLVYPLNGIGTAPGIYTAQKFGEDPVVAIDTYYGTTLVKAGQHVYQVLANMKGHNGWDIAASKGTPIMAVHSGHVTMEPSPGVGYGNEIRLGYIENNVTYDWVYGHLDRFEGTSRDVVAGEVIGYVNSTGFSTGNHLHIGVRLWENGAIKNYDNGYLGYLDPAPLFLTNSNTTTTMRLVNDKGTVYLLAGVTQKVKIGIADVASLQLFGDEPVQTEDTSAIPETSTVATGQIIHKK